MLTTIVPHQSTTEPSHHSHHCCVREPRISSGSSEPSALLLQATGKDHARWDRVLRGVGVEGLSLAGVIAFGGGGGYGGGLNVGGWGYIGTPRML